MTCSNRVTVLAGAFVILLAQACDFSPTTSFSGFDNKGSRISGTFTSDGGSAAGLTAAARTEFDGITVSIRQDSSISTAVKSNGTFSLEGIPQGNVTADFRRDGGGIGAITFQGVRANQEIRIVVALTDDGKVVLVDQERDQVDNGECLARGDGFWCNNKDRLDDFGLEFETLADLAAGIISDLAADMMTEVPELDTGEEVGARVCDTSDQLLRKMATLALNIAAGWVTFDDVSELLGEAIEATKEGATKDDRNDLKDLIEEVNECGEVDDGEEDDGEPPPATPCDAPSGAKKITICHNGKNTLSISVNAWPAHAAHGDTCGACP